MYDFFNALEKFLNAQTQLPGESESSYDRQVRLTPARRSNPEWSGIEIAWEEFGATLAKVRDAMEKIYKAWTDLDSYDVPSQPDLETELAFAMRRVSETRTQLEALITKPQATGIYWANIQKNNGNISLHVAPLYVGDLLQKQLFAGKDTVVLTSATLRVGTSFDYIKTRLGIGDWADQLAVGSPFDYAKMAMVYVPTDVPGAQARHAVDD